MHLGRNTERNNTEQVNKILIKALTFVPYQTQGSRCYCYCLGFQGLYLSNRSFSVALLGQLKPTCEYHRRNCATSLCVIKVP